MPDDENVQSLETADATAQQTATDDGNESQVNSAEPKATEYVDVKGVKIPTSEFEALAKEKYKDRFDAYDNMSKWRAENDRRAAEIKKVERDAQAYRAMMAEKQANAKSPYDLEKEAYVQRKAKSFPEVDPRFFESQFEDIWEYSGKRSNEAISPIIERQGAEEAGRFLQAHPDVVVDSPEYDKIVDYIKKGIDPEDAYTLAYPNAKVEQAIKAREEEAKRKLQQSRQQPSNFQKPKSKDLNTRAWDIIDKMVP